MFSSRADAVENGHIRLKEGLESSIGPARAAAEFRQSSGLGSSRCDALVELIRLSTGSRPEVHRSLLVRLVKGLEASVPTMDAKSQDALLKKSFYFINSDLLRPIPVALMRSRADIPEEYLRTLALSPELAEGMSLQVQRQVWEHDDGARLFEAKVGPLLDAYAGGAGAKHAGYFTSRLTLVKLPTDAWRHQSAAALHGLVDLVGPRQGLLDRLCGVLARRFAEACGAAGAGAGHAWCCLLADVLLDMEVRIPDRKARPANAERRLRVARIIDQAKRAGALEETQLAELLRGLKLCLQPAAHAKALGTALGKAALPAKGSAPPPPRPGPTVDRKATAKALRGLLSGLAEADHDRLFAEPVTDSMVPGYSDVIKQPMALSVIRTKLGAYASVDAMGKDVELMLANCVKFNGKGHFADYAKRVQSKWRADATKAKALLRAMPPPPPPAAGTALQAESGPTAPLLAQSLGSGMDAAVAVLLVAAAAPLLRHSVARAVDQVVIARGLPGRHAGLGALVQLQAVATGAAAMVRRQAFAVPDPSAHSLRVALPLLARALGEAAAGGGAALLDAALADAAFGGVFSDPAARSAALALAGSAIAAQATKASGDTALAKCVGLLKLLALHGDAAAAGDRSWLDAVVKAGLQAQPPLACRSPEVRAALLDCLARLAERHGAAPTDEALVKLLAGWAAMAPAPWATAAEAEAALRRRRRALRPPLAAAAAVTAATVADSSHGADGAPPAKRIRGGLPATGAPLGDLTAEYAKLRAAGVDVDAALRD